MTGRRIAFLFPGQGAYLPGALRLLADEPVVRQTVAEVDQALAALDREPISPLLLDAAAPALADLAHQRPADLHMTILATELALFRLLTDRLAVRPAVLVGHSFGELVALTAGGALTLEQGVRLVDARDRAFAAWPPPAGGLVAVAAPARLTEHLIGLLDDPELALAADNSPRQCVVSGSEAALARLRWATEALGITSSRLPVPYAFHNPLLARVALHFKGLIADLAPARPVWPLYSPVLGRRYRAAEPIGELAVAHLLYPTGFRTALRELTDGGVDRFVECGPRGVLADLAGAGAVAALRRATDLAGVAAAVGAGVGGGMAAGDGRTG
ncbi:ACP S-malonyltransferase [Kitasatospora sp. NPDC006697]|uniref:ACP S-malonyltransferase n=1 Tax=Kitasatospora sp. NPDC006697 TaxID=3364020 RepID=UPI00367A04E6